MFKINNFNFTIFIQPEDRSRLKLLVGLYLKFIILSGILHLSIFITIIYTRLTNENSLYFQ